MRPTLILLLFIPHLTYSQVNLNQGLIAYYPFTGNASDASGNNNNPVFNNATLTTDRIGNPNSAYHFNGVDNYMRVPNSPTLNMTNQMSISLWVRPTGFYTGPCINNMMVMKGNTDYLPGNYFLRFADAPTGCTTPNFAAQTFYGQGVLAPGPFVQLNQWYHVAWTSDGTTVKIYVNCVLQQSAPAAGFTFSNPDDLFMGHMNDVTFPYWLNGDLDDVRIYNRALNPDEIKVLGGCTNIVSNIINYYTPVLAQNPCENKLTVEDASGFGAGDTVLMIQMKGAVIDSSNSASFGTITNYKNAGHYEFNYVKAISGNIVELKNKLTRQYDIPDGKVQLIRVPYFNNAIITATLTCLPWDGSKGGVLVFNVQDSISLNANMDVSGRGFKGGRDPLSSQPTFDCYENQYFYPNNPDLASEKGEGIAIISLSKSFGKGPLANGGGGGNSHNSGGGGGANGGSGGFGGYNFEGSPCDANVPFDNRGIGGKSLTYSNANNRIFMGGGGGGGHSNLSPGFQAIGGNGGGIIIINANKIRSNNNFILADGMGGVECNLTGSICHEGMGGGGAGGMILLNINAFVDNANIGLDGGKGANMTAAGFLRVGPGGGGGAGSAWFKLSFVPVNVLVSTGSGFPGVAVSYGNDPWGATSGQLGQTLFDLQLPIDNIPFTPNIDSVRITNNLTTCNAFNFNGLAYTNSSPISTWNWNFGDGGTAASQNTSHTYTSAGLFTVKLVVTDMNGCKDSITRNVPTQPNPSVTTIADPTTCSGSSVILTTSGALTYSWSPTLGLSNPNISSPTATPSVTTQYIVTGTDANGCPGKDTVIVNINPKPVISKSGNVTICQNSSTQLSAGGGVSYSWSPTGTLNNSNIPNPVASPAGTTMYYVIVTDANGCINNDSIKVSVLAPLVFSINSPASTCLNSGAQLIAAGGNLYSWQPSSSLNNPFIANPIASPLTSTTYTVTITETTCNQSSTLSTMVTVLPLPVISASSSNDLDCNSDHSQLDATGGSTYTWSPAATLNNPNIPNPIAKPLATTQYIVKGIDQFGCANFDSVTVNITSVGNGLYLMPSGFTPNHDGKNDCYGVSYWGLILELDFSIYNRWGQRVFHATDPNACWDGTFNGALQNMDVFVYMITAKTVCEPHIFRKGTFVLIR